MACFITGIVSMTRWPRPVRSVGTSRQPSNVWPSAFTTLAIRFIV